MFDAHPKRRVADKNSTAVGRWKRRMFYWRELKPVMLASLHERFPDIADAKAFLEAPRPELKGKSFKERFKPIRVVELYTLFMSALNRLRKGQ